VKTPRDLSGAELAKALGRLGYRITRQTGSHLRITTQVGGEHHEIIPQHKSIKIGTLKSILRNVSHHHGLSIPELRRMLEDKG